MTGRPARASMVASLVLLGLVAGAAAQGPQSAAEPRPEAAPANPAIDMPGFLEVAGAAALHREQRRLTELQFLEMSREPGTIVLDARSAQRFAELHVRGAVNLSFPDITVDSLALLVPDRSTRILIYCNNNFVNAEGPFPSKLPSASLNLSTFISLYDYGYRNVWELGPQLDPAQSILPFESAPAAPAAVLSAANPA